MTVQQVLDKDFLQIRWLALELAAAMDRLDRATPPGKDDPRLVGLRKAMEVLASHEPDRAERVQLIFSREYDPNWRK